jgi:hypothetical protein
MARKMAEKRLLSKIESHHSGYMLSVDILYVCRIKGIGRIYQFSTTDTYSSFGFVNLYKDKTSKSAIDFILKTINTFNSMCIIVERILTYHGKKYATH